MSTAQKWLDRDLHDAGPDYKGGPQFTCIKCKQTYPTHESSRCPASDLATELAKAFDDKGKREVRGTPCWLCSVGDCDGCEHYKIKLDCWNVAKYWQNKSDFFAWEGVMIGLYQIERIAGSCTLFQYWLTYDAQPKHFLIAAAMALEGAKNE